MIPARWLFSLEPSILWLAGFVAVLLSISALLIYAMRTGKHLQLAPNVWWKAKDSTEPVDSLPPAPKKPKSRAARQISSQKL